MIKNWLSRYHWRYLQSLVYMLQASEYNLGDYLAWLGRTKNFLQVEQRKRLVKTPKAILFLTISWLLIVFLVAAVVSVLSFDNGFFKYLLLFLLILIAPCFLAYGLAFFVLIFQLFTQKPLEYFIARKIQKELASHQALKIAIAGSFGKTSMREILKTVLSTGKKVAAPPDSYNTILGINKFVQGLSDVEEVLVFELGEYYPGDVRRLCRIVQPDVGVITGINEAHLKKFKSLDQTVKTIFELVEWFGDKAIYINGESELAKKNARPKDVPYSRNGCGGWQVKNPTTDLTGTTFTLSRNNQEIKVKSKLLGLHQIGPLVVAVDIAASLGLSPAEIQKGIAQTKPFAHRLELKDDSSEVITIDDSYNGNPDGVRAAIEFLASCQNYRRFYVTPGLVEMGDRAAIVHRAIGQELARAKIEKVVLIKNSVTSYIEEGLRQSNYRGEVLWFESAPAAFAALPHLTVKGDLVLLQNDWPDQYQ